MAKKVTGLKIAIQTGTTNTLYASWTALNDKNLDHYAVTWTYGTGDGVWFSLEESDVKTTNDTCNIPDNAKKVKVKVKPVAKTITKNGKDTVAWSGENVAATWNTVKNPPEKPDVPDYELDGMKLTLTSTVTDPLVDGIIFEIYRDGKSVRKKEVEVTLQKASYTLTLSGNATVYKVRCQAANDYRLNKKNATSLSEWSDFSDDIKLPPLKPTNLTVVRDGKTSVKLTWTPNGSKATSYEIQYTTDVKFFDSGSGVNTHTVENGTTAIITGIETGEKWFFRIRAKNEQGESAWTKDPRKVSIILGEKPSPPTTWSSSNTAHVGETVNLYWTHNSEDGSRLTSASIELTINGTTSTIPFTNTTEEDYDTGIYSYSLNLGSYTDGATILWRVRAKGVDDQWSDWSTQREIDLYAPPTVTITMEDKLTTFPYGIAVNAQPTTQSPVSWSFVVTAETGYMGTDAKGEEKYISKGTTLYSFVYTTSAQSYTFNLSPSLITLEDGETYKVTVTVAMDSGLTAEASDTFTVQWSDVDYSPDMGYYYDKGTLSMLLYPYCQDDNGNYISDVTLSVYRREYDGSFTEIGSNLRNGGYASITDEHPSLDMARYRVVATNKSTGQMGYSDIPGIPINEPFIVIQWDETHVDYNFAEEDEPVEPAWSGSMVKIPYNVDTSESPSPDVSLVSYIGRRNPVSYYGTQINEAANWSCVIPKDDTDTLYQLRRLAAWMGDCYVREPSGVGYNAHVQVSIDNKHKELTIPVKFSITRVEGGK